MILVIAGNKHTYTNWLHVHKLTPQQAIYVHSRKQLQGKQNVDYVLIGEYTKGTLFRNVFGTHSLLQHFEKLYHFNRRRDLEHGF